jgi:hypothetical protein
MRPADPAPAVDREKWQEPAARDGSADPADEAAPAGAPGDATRHPLDELVEPGLG